MRNEIDIATERKALGLTQAELAAAIGVNQSSVSLWERQKRVPRGPAQKVLLMVLSDLRKKVRAA
jgi:DNA-binding transcriptional regulator YiaG